LLLAFSSCQTAVPESEPGDMDTEMSDKPKIDLPDRSTSEEDEPDKRMPTFIEKTNSTSSRQQYVDVTAMIRSLQRTEGLTDCFRRGLADCDQLECAWRQYCLEKSNCLPSDSEL
jgi:hypothetical protein